MGAGRIVNKNKQKKEILMTDLIKEKIQKCFRQHLLNLKTLMDPDDSLKELVKEMDSDEELKISILQIAFNNIANELVSDSNE